MRRLLPSIAVISFAVLVACGGGGHSASSVAPALPGAGSAVAPTGTTPFAVTVAATSSVTRLGITSSAENGSPEHSVSVAAGSGNCSAAGTSRTCIANLTLPTGAQTLTVTTYGAKTVHSILRTSLSGARLSLAVGVTIAQISLDLAAAQLAGGASATTTLYVTARDANGNTIVGDFGGASIAVTSSDTTGSVTLSSTTVTAGGTPITVTYNGSGKASSVTFSASSAGVAASAIVGAALSFTAAQLIYVANGNTVLTYPDGGADDIAPLQRVTISNASTIFRAAPDGAGNIWLAVPNPNLKAVGGSWAIGSIPASASGTVAMTYLPQSVYPVGQDPWDFGVDGAGNLYLFALDGKTTSSITVYPPNSQTTPIRSVTGSNTLLTSALMQANALIGVSTDGTVTIPYFSYQSPGTPSSASPAPAPTPTTVPGGILVFAPGANGNVVPAQVISGPATVPAGSSNSIFDAHEAPDGSIVALLYPYSKNSTIPMGIVEVFAPGATGNVAPVRSITGSATGLNLTYTNFTGSRNAIGAYNISSVAVDAASRIYVSESGSQSGVNAQLLQFAAGATGNVPPVAAIGGPLTTLTQPFTIQISGGTVPPAPTGAAASVSGDFLALAPSRGWNYTTTTANPGASPPPAITYTLYSDPNPVNGASDVVLFTAPNAPVTAIGAPGAILSGEALFRTDSVGGYLATGYLPVSNGTPNGIIPIPGNLRLTEGTLTQGTTFISYAGLTATVVAVGAVPGASACPGGAAPGAMVTYSFANASETVAYVPGCGITYFSSDAGMTATLTSVGSYPSAGQQNHLRSPASVDAIGTLRTLWRTVFTPWRAK